MQATNPLHHGRGIIQMEQGLLAPVGDARPPTSSPSAWALSSVSDRARVAGILWALVVVGMLIIGRNFSAGCSGTGNSALACAHAWGYQGCLGWVPTLAAASLQFTLPLAALATAHLIVGLGRNDAWDTNVDMLCQVAALAMGGAFMSIVLWMKPWSAFDYLKELDVNGGHILANDCLQVFAGGAIFLLCLLMAAIAQQAASKAKTPLGFATPRGFIRFSKYGADDAVHNGTAPPLSPVCTALAVVLMWCLLGCLCMALSPIWNFSFRSYAIHTSEFSLYETAIGHFCADNDPGLDSASHCTREYVLKLYPDTVVFYGAMLALTLGGCCYHLLQVATTPGDALRRRLCVPWLPCGACKSYHPYPDGASVGELLLVGLGLGLYGWWVIYWRYDYERIAEEADTPHNLDGKGICCQALGLAAPDGSHWGSWNETWSEHGAGACAAPQDDHRELQIWARVFGHLTNLSCSLLLLPATKNSVWFHILGVPFERALKYHRGLGYLTYIFVTVHMSLWWLKWGLQGILWHNLTTPDGLLITPYWPHADNFTIIAAQISWLALTVMIGLAVFYRRKGYELFYYVHVPVGLGFIASAMMHAWSFWYYGAGGLFLWCLDAALRTVRTSQKGSGKPDNARFDPTTGVTLLSFPLAAFSHAAPAQYIFLTVPAISALERHPFTISSAPSAERRTLHIKAVNGVDAPAPEFTDCLARLVRDGGVEALGDVQVDGPYGSAGDLTVFEELVLIGGGIGATPVHSLLAALLHDAGTPSIAAAALRRVRVVLVARTLPELGIFAQTLYECSEAGQQGEGAEVGGGGGGGGLSFSLHLFITKGQLAESLPSPDTTSAWASAEAVAFVAGAAKQGRPDLPTLLGDIGRKDAVFVCGPAPLCATASEVAFARAAAFHTEIFYF